MTDVAFLGLGRMGGLMATNLSRAGHRLIVWNRTESKAVEFAEGREAAEVASGPGKAASRADVVISMLADDRSVLEAYLGPDGVLRGASEGQVLIDMSTVSPVTVSRLNEEATARGCVFLDAPVSGSVAAASEGSLTIMVGGPDAALEEMRPLLLTMGSSVVHMGASGAGAAMKLAVNTVVHGLNGALSEALVLAERCGIDRHAAYEVFRHSAVAAPFVHYRQAAFERPAEEPVAFRLILAAKDLRNARELAQSVGLDLPHAERALGVLDDATKAGYGDHDESAVAEYLRTQPQ